MTVAALIVAAGRGSRAASAGRPPKQFAVLAGKTVLARSIEAFALHGAIDRVLVAIHPDDADTVAALGATLDPLACAKLLAPVHGGATRQETVRLGLDALGALAPRLVLVHDAARPFVDRATIERVVAALGRASGAIAAIPVSDTLKRDGPGGRIAATIDRAGLWRAQTPQGFDFALLRAAHARAHAAGLATFTDDAAIAEWAGLDVALVEGSERNVKLTTAEDIAMAHALLDRAEPAAAPHPQVRPDAATDVRAEIRAKIHAKIHLETRTGTGFDVHRFAPGSSVWLCGVEVPHAARLDGHSDADVGLHALTDALLGAIGAGDIGQHFPPSDMRWKGAASHIFLSHAAGLVRQRGGRIVNVDVTILAEAPRVGPHRAAMCTRIAEILEIEAARVSVKATTTEGLGFTGRREGIAAMATANVELTVAPLPPSTAPAQVPA